ncbi:MAG: glycosyltransferase [Thermodesulfobacteriota bacterium]|nr:glycosyltransferase [Thermodesulfobacteriota bacterium]
MGMQKGTVAHFVHSYLFPTGSWIYTQLINMKRYRPVVLTSTLENQDQFPFKNVYCYRQAFKGTRIAQVACRKVYETITQKRKRYFTGVIRGERARLLHAHFGTEGYYNLALQRTTHLPLVTTFYGLDVSKLPSTKPKWRERYRALFEVGVLFLAEGPFMAEAIVDLGCPAEKVRVQHLGVDVQRIRFVPRFQQDGQPVRILMACSFREKKGIRFGIEAFAKAVRKHPNMELRIIGGANTSGETRLMERCKKIALKEGAGEKVRFLGYISYSDYLKEITCAHIFLAPSVRARDGDTEGGAPVSVIEASAAGMPVIASRHCDIPNVIIDDEAGILVPERNVDALTEAILSLACAPECWAALGEAGRKRVVKEFDVVRQVARLESLYDEALGQTVEVAAS